MKSVRKRFSRAALPAAMLLVCFAAITFVNLLAPAGFYDADMYTDMRYSVEVWNQGSVLPRGWIFGNQLYAASTPVLAALFYGLTGDPRLAMGLASTVMAALVLAGFAWMLRPVIAGREARLTGCVLFVTLMLFFGDAWNNTQGWQLLFTMCSYYACYALTAFLAFGCWLRGEAGLKKLWLPLTAACLLSFATGFQSIRQTAVMTLPLLAAEALRWILAALRRQKPDRGPLWAALAVSAANAAGLVLARCLPVAQLEITGGLGLAAPPQWLPGLRQGILLALSLVMNHDAVSVAVLGLLVLLCGGGLIWILVRLAGRKEETAFRLLSLLSLSVLAILAADVLTTMYVRPVYYFMLFPLLAFLGAYVCAGGKIWPRRIALGFTAMLFALSCVRELPEVSARIRSRQEEPAVEISEFLLEKGYDVVYGAWNQGSELAVASDWALTAAFWEYEEEPFGYYEYLCNPEVYAADPEDCVYLFYGEEAARLGMERARDRGTELTLLRQFPESDAYLFTAPVNLMEPLDPASYTP